MRKNKPASKVPKEKNMSWGTNIKRYWPLYLMVVPGLIYVIMFKIVPIFGSVIAFQDFSVFKGIKGSKWVGFKNFEKIFQYSDFARILRNTLILGLIKTIFTFPFPIIMSLMLNEIRGTKLKKTIQTAIYVPHFLSWVVVGGLVFDLFGMNGIFNQVRSLFGMEPILVMQKESWFRPIYVFSSIWKEAGWGTVVYLAAMSGIDPALYEAAQIDGASRFNMIRYITLPLLIPTALTLFLLNIGSFMELGFDQVQNLLTPMTYGVGDIFDTYVYRVGILKAQYSTTTAIGLFQSVVGLILVVVFNKLSNKFSSEGGLW